MNCKAPGCNFYMGENPKKDYCHYCRTKLTHCKIDEFGFKYENFTIPVPWCWRDDERIDGKYEKCHKCEHYSKEKVYPEGLKNEN